MTGHEWVSAVIYSPDTAKIATGGFTIASTNSVEHSVAPITGVILSPYMS